MSPDDPTSAPRGQDDPPALWRTGAGLCLFAVLYSALIGLWFVAATPPLARLLPGPQALSLLMLYSFATALLALALVMWLLHGRGPGTVAGAPGLLLRQALRVALYVLPVIAVVALLPLPEAFTPSRNLETGRWLSLLPLALLGVAIQIAAEEFLFRGYLQSRLQARFRHRGLWIGLPALLFGVLHFDPSAGDNAPWFVLYATLFGLAAGDLTARAGTLGPALALHFLNNAIALTLLSFPDELGGLALFHLPLSSDDPALLQMIPIELASTGVLWLAGRVALGR